MVPYDYPFISWVFAGRSLMGKDSPSHRTVVKVSLLQVLSVRPFLRVYKDHHCIKKIGAQTAPPTPPSAVLKFLLNLSSLRTTSTTACFPCQYRLSYRPVEYPRVGPDHARQAQVQSGMPQRTNWTDWKRSTFTTLYPFLAMTFFPASSFPHGNTSTPLTY